MKNFKLKLSSIIFTFTVLNIFIQHFSFAMENKNIEGRLHGKILAPKDADLSSVVIQIIGANPKDKFMYYTLSNAHGEFNFDGLPAGSLVQLYLWDANGILNRTILNAYVNSISTKDVLYEIAMERMQYTQDIAHIYNTTHDITSAGICGAVMQYHRLNHPNVKILAYDREAKYHGPLYEQNVDTKNQFCFFNLNSISGTDMYDFVILGPSGESKTFTFYLPPSTFLHNVILDTSASLYRTIRPYFWQENFFSKTRQPWVKLDAVHLSTSDDYAFVPYDETQSRDNLFYFPLSNEVLEISYFLNGEDSNRFFILMPRTKLTREPQINISHISYADHIYVDYEHPIPLQLVTESELIKLNSNFYFQTYSETFGSVFVNIDLSQFGIRNTNEVKLSLRNLGGKEVNTFEELITVQENNLLGFFLNLLPGRYQLFLKNLNGELLWTYEVRSYPNRIQVLTNDWDQLKPMSLSLPHKTQLSNEPAQTQKLIFNPQSEILIIDNYNKSEMHSLQEEKNFLKNNIIYKYDSDIFCKKIAPPGILEKLMSFRD